MKKTSIKNQNYFIHEKTNYKDIIINILALIAIIVMIAIIPAFIDSQTPVIEKKEQTISKTTSTPKVAPAKPQQEIKPIRARVTKYLKTGNRMANGEYPHKGAVAVSDRTIPLGTKVIIDNKEYTIKDRTAKWVDEKFGLTIDIFTEETEQQALEFGSRSKLVTFKD